MSATINYTFKPKPAAIALDYKDIANVLRWRSCLIMLKVALARYYPLRPPSASASSDALINRD
jgi:hypothetical protein